MKKIIFAVLVSCVVLAGCMTEAQKGMVASQANLTALTATKAVAAMQTVPDADQNKIDALAGFQQLLRGNITLVQSAQINTELSVTLEKALNEALSQVQNAVLKANKVGPKIAG